MLVLQPASGLYFPTIETLREALVSQALQGTWAWAGLVGSPRAPRCPLCTHPAPHGPALAVREPLPRPRRLSQGCPPGRVCPSFQGRSLSAAARVASPQHVSEGLHLLPESVFGEKGSGSLSEGNRCHCCCPILPACWDRSSGGLALSPKRDRHAPVSAASPPRCAILDCTHVCSLDYTVVLGLRELLGDFRRQGVTLAFVGLQVGVPTQLALSLQPAREVSLITVLVSGRGCRGPEKLSHLPEVTQRER